MAATFTPLEELPKPTITASSEAYPGGAHNVQNLLDKTLKTEYSSKALGDQTFVEFDFGTTREFAAFKHIERNDPATVAASELTFLTASGAEAARLQIEHVNQRGGVTLKVFDKPIAAQKVRWHITKVGAGLATVGGAEVAFFAAGRVEESPTAMRLEVRPLEMIERGLDGPRRALRVTIDYPYAERVEAVLNVEGSLKTIALAPGVQVQEVSVPETRFERQVPVLLKTAGQTLKELQLALKPARHWEIYVLPHSHVDIGYTALQADVVKKQNENIATGLRLAKSTAEYPQGARFKWNVEVLWPVENYLSTASPEQRDEFIAAVKNGQIGLDAFYGNILTGLCRPEELIQLMGYATRLSALCSVPVESAMISDVPGYTWSTVSAMAQAGVRYFSFAPNYFDRMGGTMREWQNKPFWWKGPDGQSRVLCWCPSRGYALGHLIGDGAALTRSLPDYLLELQTNAYPYDITHLRWNVHGDNGSPDEKVADVVKEWNEKYFFPHLTIATTAEAFRAFERRYGDKLPVFSGDYTPYWEDGAASSALETAMNRAAAERLVQAEALWAMRNPCTYPAADFHKAWQQVLLYSEHTWGAHNSISEPDVPFVRDQWRVKRDFAVQADKLSRELLAQASGALEPGSSQGFVVYNTSSWERTDLITLSADQSTAGDGVLDDCGKSVPAQRLHTGELAFLASKVPAFGSRSYRVTKASAAPSHEVSAEQNRIYHPDFSLKIDEITGAISSLYVRSLDLELVDKKASTALNDYFYLPGADLQKVKRNGRPSITVTENGPLVASLVIESEAPGCKRLVREVRAIAGLNRVDLINTIDKLPIREKEGLHFGFGFNVPDAQVRMDVGLAQVRPEIDQIPAACKNWFSVQRWVDVANEDFGVTWASVDAPLLELGQITANLVGSQNDWRVWIQHSQPSATLFSWVMNNHWHTNYRAEQEGPTVFRYSLYPHGKFRPEEAAKFGIAASQPLIVTPDTQMPPRQARLRLSSDKVVVMALKPSDDGRGTIVRLLSASGKPQQTQLLWANPVPKQVWLSDTSELPRERAGKNVQVPAWGVVTVRAE